MSPSLPSERRSESRLASPRSPIRSRQSDMSHLYRCSAQGMLFAPSPALSRPNFAGRSLEVFADDLIRRPQRQCRKSQRRIGGRDGGERAAADQVEIVMVVRALERVDHRIFATFAHAMGSDEVPGAVIFYASRLTRRPFERARIVRLRFRRELFRVHAI